MNYSAKFCWVIRYSAKILSSTFFYWEQTFLEILSKMFHYSAKMLNLCLIAQNVCSVLSLNSSPNSFNHLRNDVWNCTAEIILEMNSEMVSEFISEFISEIALPKFRIIHVHVYCQSEERMRTGDALPHKGDNLFNGRGALKNWAKFTGSILWPPYQMCM